MELQTEKACKIRQSVHWPALCTFRFVGCLMLYLESWESCWSSFDHSVTTSQLAPNLHCRSRVPVTCRITFLDSVGAGPSDTTNRSERTGWLTISPFRFSQWSKQPDRYRQSQAVHPSKEQHPRTNFPNKKVPQLNKNFREPQNKPFDRTCPKLSVH